MFRFRLLYALMLFAICFVSCDDDEGVNPGFDDPPENYYLIEEVVVLEDGDNTSADLNFFRYNDMGKLSGDGIFYDNQGRLIQSPWPNRTVLNGLYYYDGNVPDSIVTFGHPRYTLYFDMEYEDDRPSAVRIYRRENDQFELVLIEDLQVTYPSPQEILITAEDRTLHYQLDEGRNPYPYEYRLSHWWWPYSQNLPMILTDRNVVKLTVTIDGAVTTEAEYSYEYNEYGFATKQTRGNRSIYFKYSETLN